MSTKMEEKDTLGELTALAMTPELSNVFDEFMQLRQVYSAGIKEIRTKLEILDDEFKARYDHNPIHNMEYRLKSPRSLMEKASKKNIPLTLNAITKTITDIAGVRVICNYIQDIYKIADLLTSQDDITIIKCKDYIKNPKPNGYCSLHLVLEVPIFLADRKQPIPVEIQIRTIAMDFWASLEHELKYKSSNNITYEMQEELLECANTITSLDLKMQMIHNQVDSER
ncbi:MAG: GTP pyrophosphokinase family protein [Coprobacillaceae bacterium]